MYPISVADSNQVKNHHTMKKILKIRWFLIIAAIFGIASSTSAVTYYDSSSTPGDFMEIYTAYPTSACSVSCIVTTTYSAFGHIEVDRLISGIPYQVLETYQQYQESGTVTNSTSNQPAGTYVTEHYGSVWENAYVSLTTGISW